MVPVAIAFVAGPVYDSVEYPVGFAFFGACLGVLALVSLRQGRAYDVAAIEISRDGIRRMPADLRITWSEVVGLRERQFFQRIDLIVQEGSSGIALEYQLENFEEALDEVLQRVRIEVPTAPHTFRRSRGRAFFTILILGFSLLGVWAWAREGAWAGLLLMGLMLTPLVIDMFCERTQVSVLDGILTLRRGLRNENYAIRDITAAYLALRPAGMGYLLLDVVVETGGKQFSVRTAGADPFVLHSILKSHGAPQGWLTSG